MPDFLDTSVLVRYLTADPQDLAPRARQVIESGAQLTVTETALNETAHALRHFYGLTREETVDLLIALLQRSNLTFHGLDKAMVITALLLCRPSGRVSFGDALIWAAARCLPPSVVYSFDQRFPRDGIEVRQP
jgi:predicted nucleic-acid-binding protein